MGNERTSMDGGAGAPLSSMQQGLWLQQQLEPSASHGNLTGALILEGPLEVQVLAACLSEVVARHEILRTHFPVGPSGQPVQVVRPPAPIRLEAVDLSMLPKEEALARVEEACLRQGRTPFRLEVDPLLRFELYRLGPDQHALVNTMHHIVFDLGSRDILFRELAALYEAQVAGRPSTLAPPAAQFRDFARWQADWAARKSEAQLGYWREQLRGAPSPAALPFARGRTRRGTTGEGRFVRKELSAEVTTALRQLAKSAGASGPMVCLTLFQVWLARVSGQLDVCVAMAGSTRRRGEHFGVIGPCLNSAALRLVVEESTPFNDALARTRRAMLGWLDNVDVPFDAVTEALASERSGAPLFRSWFFFQPRSVELRLGPVRGTVFVPRQAAINSDLTLHVTERAQTLELELHYATELFEPSVAEQMLEGLVTLAGSIVRAPGSPLRTLALVSPEESARVLALGRGRAVEVDEQALLHQLFERQAARSGDAVAATFGGASMGYRALDELASRWATRLKEEGVGPERFVAVYCERGFELLAGLLAVLKAGGAYVPLDPEYPADRIALMLEEADQPLVLTQRRLADALPPFARRLFLDDGAPQAAATRVESGVAPKNAAYAIYTSGSTGKPKLTINHHRGISDRLQVIQAVGPLTADDVVLQRIPSVFDVSVREIFWPLAYGARLALVPSERQKDAGYIRRVIAEERVTIMHATPSFLRLLLAAGEEAGSLASIRQVFCGAEPLTADLQEEFHRQCPGQLNNMYGMTETAIEVSTFPCVRGEARVPAAPIGRPFPNTRLYLLDEHGELALAGAPGEICVGGEFIGRGYFRKPEATAEKFVPDPFSDRPGARMYRTGDLGRWLPDGVVEFCGRRDLQVKVRGHRIELGEIEAALRRQSELRDAVVVARPAPQGDTRLIAYVLFREPLDAGVLRRRLASALPDYMVPAAFVPLEAFPLNTNGKVDREALPSPESIAAPAATASQGGEESALERRLKAIYARVLGSDAFGVEDSFFEIGGDSILSLEVVSLAREEGLSLSLDQIFEQKSVRAICERLSSAPAREVKGGPSRAPLTPIQLDLLALGSPGPDHHNIRPIQLELPGEVSPALAKEALQAVVAHHPSLRLAFDFGEGPSQRVVEPREVPFELVDLRAVAAPERAGRMEAVAGRLQRGFRLAEGQPVAAALFQLGATQRLVVFAHHLVVDASTERIVIDDLIAALGQRRAGAPIALPAPTTAYLEWAQRLAEHARAPEIRAELPFWLEQGQDPTVLPLDFDRGADDVASERVVSRRLPPGLSQALLRQGSGTLAATLVCSVAEAIGRWAGASSVVLETTGHGRTSPWPEVDLTRTVGWFSTFHPLRVSTFEPAEVARTLAQVSRSGLGYGLLRHLGTPDDQRALARRRPAVVVNYLGQYRERPAADPSVRVLSEELGPRLDPGTPRRHPLAVMAYAIDDALTLEWAYSAHRHRPETISGLIADVERSLAGRG